MQRKSEYYEKIRGSRRGKLLILDVDHTEPKRGKIWRCLCDCGKEAYFTTSEIVSGHRSSCPDCGRDASRTRSKKQLTKHGCHGSRLYSIWRAMISRCTYKGDTNYKYYGARGITVCSEWRSGFEPFCDWALLHGYSEDLSIDRIDPNGNYEPMNCRWATKLEQANNKRTSKFVTVNGETHTVSQWCSILGVYKTAIYNAEKRRGIKPEDFILSHLVSGGGVQEIEVFTTAP